MDEMEGVLRGRKPAGFEPLLRAIKSIPFVLLAEEKASPTRIAKTVGRTDGPGVALLSWEARQRPSRSHREHGTAYLSLRLVNGRLPFERFGTT